ATEPIEALGLSSNAAAIHQEVVFKAKPERVYEALTDAARFEQVTRLSAAMREGMTLGTKATRISREIGGDFVLFGGYIEGRQLFLAPNRRIVQAWRTAGWNEGDFSTVSFELKAQGSETRLIFDHTGFPTGAGQHLAEGWRANYWEPLAKYLAQ